MALCLPGRTLPVTAAAAPSTRRARLHKARTPTATMAGTHSAALVALGRRRLGAAAASAWTRGSSSTVTSRVMMARAMAASSSSSSSSTSTKAVADADVIKTETDGAARTGGYPYAEIEAKWQKHWADNKTFKTPEQIDTSKPKFYALDMFPYPRCAWSRVHARTRGTERSMARIVAGHSPPSPHPKDVIFNPKTCLSAFV